MRNHVSRAQTYLRGPAQTQPLEKRPDLEDTHLLLLKRWSEGRDRLGFSTVAGRGPLPALPLPS